MASKIEDIIDEIEALIDDCKPVPLSANKIAVNRDDLENLLQELRSKTPEEIRKYQKIIGNREAILADAQQKANEMLADAKKRTDGLVNEHVILQEAHARANEIISIAESNARAKIDRATDDANQIRLGAIAYTDDLLKNVQDIVANAIDTTRTRSENFLATMQTYLDTIEQNRAVLLPEEDASSANAASASYAAPDNSAAQKEEEEVPPLDIPEGFFNKD